MGFQGLGVAVVAGLIQSILGAGLATAIAPEPSALGPPVIRAEAGDRLDSAPLGPAPGAGSSTAPIEVKTILVEGSTVFSPRVLAEAVVPFEGRALTLEELQAAANAVTQLYLNAGYITSEAVLPPQPVQEGVVRLQVVEGGLEEIRVVGTDRLVSYVQQRIALAGTRPLNQNQLEGQLQLLQRDPLFDNVEASLRQGQEADGSILTVQVTEAPPVSGSLAIDTLSPRSVGEFRTGGTLQYNNLAGWGDRLVASAYRSTTGGSYAYELSYLVPLNPKEGTLLLRATPSSYSITDPTDPTFGLEPRGSTDSYEIQYRQPLIRTLREELALSAGFRYRNGSTLLGGVITPPTVTSVVSFGQDYLRRDPSGAWGLQSQFRLGTGLFGATLLPDPSPSGEFFSWQGQVQRLQVLGPNHQLLVRGAVQLASSSLLGSEQFFIGGAQSVRGYYQNGRFGDNGLRLAVEDQITLLRDENQSALLSLSPFLDLGYVWAHNRDFRATNQNFLLGTGLGVMMTPVENVDARVDFGIPLIALDELASDRPSGLRVYFDVRYRF
ncbi:MULTISPECIES: ShlB/FhaC/HecB family hemolysin secretion/activation protein [Cyanophyceae]|uniref:ShlB/FhaC/HecB family hemolysin secretion/activation protein n=1 Tax=Leptolyngbya subtilissima DQ-A4 TaxID=2933933 RepID=A0ABV0K321_9CYAN|nr:ShlB/FhaC/HecB family hemolysin secretion/activation protein [Nodosilinea sp. FACHB-141]MBD2113159.1 ShlB/FhaC/HecB family hemolysin secretion/activation protein [Nodosilinea sp. FACHB-141]